MNESIGEVYQKCVKITHQMLLVICFLAFIENGYVDIFEDLF